MRPIPDAAIQINVKAIKTYESGEFFVLNVRKYDQKAVRAKFFDLKCV